MCVCVCVLLTILPMLKIFLSIAYLYYNWRVVPFNIIIIFRLAFICCYSLKSQILFISNFIYKYSQ